MTTRPVSTSTMATWKTGRATALLGAIGRAHDQRVARRDQLPVGRRRPSSEVDRDVADLAGAAAMALQRGRLVGQRLRG